jgi:Na+/H+ antiporter NhaD/arsenite permease-like protein
LADKAAQGEWRRLLCTINISTTFAACMASDPWNVIVIPVVITIVRNLRTQMCSTHGLPGLEHVYIY